MQILLRIWYEMDWLIGIRTAVNEHYLDCSKESLVI